MREVTDLISEAALLVIRRNESESLEEKVEITAQVLELYALIAESRGDDSDQEVWEMAADIIREIIE